MTNAEYYLKDEIDANNLYNELGRWIEKRTDRACTFKTYADMKNFFERERKYTLTEDERVILRNIDTKAFRTIGRRKSGGLYVKFSFQDETYNASIFNDDLFQFIKERRRI